LIVVIDNRNAIPLGKFSGIILSRFYELSRLRIFVGTMIVQTIVDLSINNASIIAASISWKETGSRPNPRPSPMLKENAQGPLIIDSDIGTTPPGLTAQATGPLDQSSTHSLKCYVCTCPN